MKKRISIGLLLVVVMLVMVSLACQAGSIGQLFATSTPTSTNTPSPTQTPPATSTPTVKPTGTTKTDQPDGSVLFTDYDNQYSVVFPQGWTAINLNSEDLNKLLDSASGSNPDIEKALALIKNMDPNTFRIFAFDFRTGHILNGYVSNVNIVAENNSLMNGMTLQNLVDVNAQSLPQYYPNIKILSSEVTTTASGIQVGVIETNLPLTTSSGDSVLVYQQVNIIELPNGIVMITLAVPTSIQTTLLPEFNGIIGSFKILDQ